MLCIFLSLLTFLHPFGSVPLTVPNSSEPGAGAEGEADDIRFALDLFLYK